MAAAIVATACEARSPVGPAPVDPAISNMNATGGMQSAANSKGGSASVGLCHITGNGDYKPLMVNEHAVPAHRAHGDARTGETVPTAAGMVFDEACEPIARSVLITSGNWVISRGSWPRFTIDVAGQDFRLAGSWDQAGPGPSLTYTAGSVVTLGSLFQNAAPQTNASFARGTAIVGGIDYGFVELGGELTFVTDPLTIPIPASNEAGQRLIVTTPFSMSGVLKGYEVLNRREPLLVFEVPVSGRGVATLELQSGPAGAQTLQTGQLTYAFTGVR